ncbi:glutamine amidotransferase class-II [Methanocaldococcus villosus KIN24-T80]|uniref:Glutamine amidotransferase class-II n=1 Tax=Methanocaldococcus villosus KIN24-T80 TaxID=1069083 RepID=N6V065_9EURY|nr:glutamine amidotransferase family protein [Methanocaldococcus villosus]ENN95698.1 glutamine amidotransferase class-II [Methanocaldococcus villosus KIN24-T80]
MCGIIGFMSRKKRMINGEKIALALNSLRERGNGRGSGYVGYGIYPNKYKDCYALHVLIDNTPKFEKIKIAVENVLNECGTIVKDEEIPTEDGVIEKVHIPWRYFYEVDEKYQHMEEDIIVNIVMEINDKIDGAYVISSGKDLGVFKAVGWPDEVAEFYKIDKYDGYLWLAHARYPTNTKAWWGGAHPFNLLNWSVVHNGEITSYGTNRRFVEMYGYKCRLLTDTEVVTYILDLLLRKHKIPVEYGLFALAPKFWNEIDKLPEEEREVYKAIRMTYGGALLNGPFAIAVGTPEGLFFMNGEIEKSTTMIGLTDRIKLRPLVAAEKDDIVFVSSEESAIRRICPDLDRVWMPDAGEPIIVRPYK